MTGVAHKRRIGWSAALVAAYALVFNVILSSIFIATVSPLDAFDAHELCLRGADANSVPTDADKGSGKIVVHCPLCLSHHAADVPRLPVDLTDRIALRIEAVHSFKARIFARARSFAHLSRGPPGLS